LGKSVHLNCPGKKHNSGFGLPLITVSKIKKKHDLKQAAVTVITSQKTAFRHRELLTKHYDFSTLQFQARHAEEMTTAKLNQIFFQGKC